MGQKSCYTPQNFNILDTKKLDWPWKMYLQLQVWRHFGYLKFLGRKTPEYFHQRQHGIDMLNPTNPGTMLGRTRLTFIFSKKSKAIFQSWLFLSESKKFCCHTLVKENGTTNHLPSGKIILLVSHLQMYSVRSEKMQLSLLPELPSSSHWWSWERNHKSAMFEASFARAC